MALILLVLVPAAVGTWLVAGGRHLSATVTARIGLGTAVVAAGLAGEVARSRPEVDRAWLPSMDVRLHLGVDGIAIPLVLLTAAVGLLVMIHALGEVPTGGSPSTFIGSLLLVQTGALATFTARDAVLFFVAFELVLVPMWVLIARFGDPHHPRARADAAARFLLYTVVGSTLMLVGILLLVTATGTADLDALTREGADLPHGQQVLIALLLTIGLAVKVPVFPLHTWLPPAHTTAPTAGSVLLAAVLLKMGTYGLVRLPLATVPDGFALIAPALAIAGVLGIIWGGLVCLVERDLKRLVAFSSVAHMGFVVLALATGTALGLQAALFGNIAHGLVSALLFVIVGGLKSRWGDVDLAILRPALRETAPHRGFLLVMGLAAALGLPGLAVFWGEFFALGAAWSPERHLSVALFRTCAVIGAIGAALAAAYCLRVASRVWVGDAVPDLRDVVDVETRGSERLVLGILALLVLALGVAPGLLLEPMAPAVAALLGGGT
ncbi:MAG: NADH-quinone oxidoreductase subunit M [Phycicoccus sp.]|nr:NADH-quinone oxidoreductase subunit M [Phycicoccus sp.]